MLLVGRASTIESAVQGRAFTVAKISFALLSHLVCRKCYTFNMCSIKMNARRHEAGCAGGGLAVPALSVDVVIGHIDSLLCAENATCREKDRLEGYRIDSKLGCAFPLGRLSARAPRCSEYISISMLLDIDTICTLCQRDATVTTSLCQMSIAISCVFALVVHPLTFCWFLLEVFPSSQCISEGF